MKPLYHGTIYDFDEIDVSAGKGYKDFGKGFYATAVPSHAERLAIRNKSIAEKRQSFLKNKKGIKIQRMLKPLLLSMNTMMNWRNQDIPMKYAIR